MKDKLTLKNLLYAFAVVLGIVSILMMFLTAFTATVSAGVASTTTNYTGVQATFGYSETVLNNTVEILAFSFMNFLPYLLLLAGVVLALLKFLGVLKSKVVDYVLIALFVVSAVLFFFAPNMVVYADDATKKIFEATTIGLGVGPILSAVFAICSAASVAVSTFFLKDKKK